MFFTLDIFINSLFNTVCVNFKINLHDIKLQSSNYIRFHVSLNVLLYTSQGYGQCQVCTCLCTLRTILLLNVLLHISEWYGCYAVCIHSCNFRIPVSMNVLITHITRYVNVDALSAYTVDWMLYYTHHSNMDAPQYVHVDVS